MDQDLPYFYADNFSGLRIGMILVLFRRQLTNYESAQDFLRNVHCQTVIAGSLTYCYFLYHPFPFFSFLIFTSFPSPNIDYFFFDQWGGGVRNFINSLIKDSGDIRTTFLYKLAQKSNLHLFKHVLLAGMYHEVLCIYLKISVVFQKKSIGQVFSKHWPQEMCIRLKWSSTRTEA